MTQPNWRGSLGLSAVAWPRFVATAAVIATHLFVGHAGFSVFELLLAGLCGSLLLNVLWSYFGRHERGIPVLEWVVLQMYVFFAMPVFFAGESSRAELFSVLSRERAIEDALIATALFFAALLGGWAAMPSRRNMGEPASRRRNSRPAIVFVYGMIAVTVTSLLSLYEVAIQGAWYASVLWFFFRPVTAQLLLLFELQRSYQSVQIRFLLFVLTSLTVLSGLLTSRLSYALLPIITVVLGLIAAGRRIPVRYGIAAILLLLVVNPSKTVYRQLTGYRTSEFSDKSVSQMVDAWTRSLEAVWIEGDEGDEEALGMTARRLNYLTINATIFHAVPGRVPYALGDSWLPVLYSPIPRVLWPDKPNMTKVTSDRFAITFGLATELATERTTAANPSIADGYWNFGWIGVILVGFLSGSFWKLIRSLWSTREAFRYVFPFLILIEVRASSALPNLISGVLQAAVACYVVIAVLGVFSRVATRRT